MKSTYRYGHLTTDMFERKLSILQAIQDGLEAANSVDANRHSHQDGGTYGFLHGAYVQFMQAEFGPETGKYIVDRVPACDFADAGTLWDEAAHIAFEAENKHKEDEGEYFPPLDRFANNQCVFYATRLIDDIHRDGYELKPYAVY